MKKEARISIMGMFRRLKIIMPFSSVSNKSLLQIHLAVFLFGFPGLFGKWIPLPSHLIVLGRVFFASLALAALLIGRRQNMKVRPFPDYGLFLLCGLILAVHWTAFFRSVQVSTVAVGLLSYSSFPVFTVFLEPLFFRERLNRLNVLFAFVCLFGMFMIVPSYDLSNSVFQGVLWGLLAGLTFAILTILNRILSLRHPSPLIAFFQDSFAAVFLLPLFFLSRPVLGLKTIALLIVLGIVCTAGAHTLFINGMRQIKAQTASIISSLEPVYGIALALFFLREVPSLRTACGGLVILSATLVVSWRASKKPAER